MLNVAIVRGKVLNKWEMQDYEPLIGRVGMTAFASRRTAFPLDDILVPIKRLRSPDYVLMENRLLRGTVGRELWRRVGLDYMIGLEQAVAGFDILHGCETNTGYTYQLARVRQRRPRVRLVSTCWETIPFLEFEQPAIRKRKRYVQSEIDLFLTMTHRAKEALLLEGVDERRTYVQYPGINLRQFQPQPRLELDRHGLWQRNDALRVLFVGSITAGKGLRDLIRAAAEVARSPRLRGRVEFGLVGNGDLADLVPVMISRLGLAEIVRHIPRVPYTEMPALYASADLFVLPSVPTQSWEEQFGMVLAESMACGKAVISTRSGAIPEVIGDAGVLVAPADYQALAAAVMDVLLDDRRRDRLGVQAAERARTLFDPEQFANNVLRKYEELAAS